MNEVDVLGLIAGAATTAAFVPQAHKVHKTKRTHDLSLGMFSVLTVGVALWIVYGVCMGALPIILANAVTLVLAVYILFMKIRHG